MSNVTKLNINVNDIVNALTENKIGFNARTNQNYRIVTSGSSLFTNGKYFLSNVDLVTCDGDEKLKKFLTDTKFILKSGVSFDGKKYIGSNDIRVGCGYITTKSQFNTLVNLFKVNSSTI